MRQPILIATFCCIIIAFLPSATGAGDARDNSATTNRMTSLFVPNEILIGLTTETLQRVAGQDLRPGQTGITSLDRLDRKYGVIDIVPLFADLEPDDITAASHGLAGVFKLTVPEGTDILTMVAEYQAEPAIAYAELNRIYSLAELPDDTDFWRQWALHNTGQTGGRSDADIDAPEAWDIERGKSTVLIAIVDTGVDYNHPDLAGGRMRTDIDRDFVNGDNDAMDDHGHGTFCAGIAAANTNNARGIAGICRNCQILPVKVLNSDGSGTAESVSQGIQYAAQSGARIISMSLGYASNCGCSQTVARTINYAFERGSLLVAAAGNNSDKQRLSYPAASPRVLSVGASDHRDQEADFSNRSQALDILAPGKNVYSLDRNARYRSADGTSAAAPHVAGVAGLVWSARPALSNTQVWAILYHSADNLPAAAGLAADTFSAAVGTHDLDPRPHKAYLPVISKSISRGSFGRLNAHQALLMSSAIPIATSQDRCTGEPDCAPECGAEIVLAGQPAALDNLSVLRTFRDVVLESSPLGRRWAALYRHHLIEAALILTSDDELRGQARAALYQWLPLFRALTDLEPSPPKTVILTDEHAEALEAVVTALASRGHPQLRDDLNEIRRTLQIRRFVGWDVYDAWRTLNAEHAAE
jgi:subtilisin family serine protease